MFKGNGVITIKADDSLNMEFMEHLVNHWSKMSKDIVFEHVSENMCLFNNHGDNAQYDDFQKSFIVYAITKAQGIFKYSESLTVTIEYSEYSHARQHVQKYEDVFVTEYTVKRVNNKLLRSIEVPLNYSAETLHSLFDNTDAMDTFTEYGVGNLHWFIDDSEQLKKSVNPSVDKLIDMVSETYTQGVDDLPLEYVEDFGLPFQQKLLLTRPSLEQYFKERKIQQVLLDSTEALMFLDEKADDIIRFMLGA